MSKRLLVTVVLLCGLVKLLGVVLMVMMLVIAFVR